MGPPAFSFYCPPWTIRHSTLALPRLVHYFLSLYRHNGPALLDACRYVG